MALVEARPDTFHELERIDVLTGKTWNHPTLAGSSLLVRNDREVVMLELAVQ